MAKRSRGNPSTQAEIELRREQVMEKLKTADHQTLSQLADDLGVSRATLWRDLQAIEARFVAGSTEDVKHFKEAQYQALLKIEEATARGTIEPDVANALTRIREAVAKLLGLNAQTKALVAHTSQPTDVRYLKFKAAADGLDDVQLEEAFNYLRQLPRTPRVTIKDASWFPAPEPKLLNTGDNDEQPS